MSCQKGLCLSALLLMVLLSGCRSKIETQVSKGRGAAVPLSIDSTNLQQYFQSESIVTFAIAWDDVAAGDQMSIVNATNSTTILDRRLQSSDLDANGALELTIDKSNSTNTPWSIVADAGSGALMQLFLGPKETRSKFVYGQNLLKLNLVSGGASKVSERQVMLRDFPMFDLTGALANGGNQDSSGGRIDVWMTNVVKPIVRGVDAGGKGRVLRYGMLHSIYH